MYDFTDSKPGMPTGKKLSLPAQLYCANAARHLNIHELKKYCILLGLDGAIDYTEMQVLAIAHTMRLALKTCTQKEQAESEDWLIKHDQFPGAGYTKNVLKGLG